MLALLATLAVRSPAQDEGPATRQRLEVALTQARYEAAGILLAILDAAGQGPGRAAFDQLRSLEPAAIAVVEKGFADQRGMSREDGRDAGTKNSMRQLLEALMRSERGQEVERVELLLPLLDDPSYQNHAADLIGRASLRLCRRGDERGMSGLAALRARWPLGAWTHGNHALGLRLLGRYEEAAAGYEDLLVRTERAAWALNDAALCEAARGRREAALTRLLEGAADARDADAADTCRTNAAVLLIERSRPGDRVRAEALLRVVVDRDATRVRARFWLARLARLATSPSGT